MLALYTLTVDQLYTLSLYELYRLPINPTCTDDVARLANNDNEQYEGSIVQNADQIGNYIYIHPTVNSAVSVSTICEKYTNRFDNRNYYKKVT